MSKNEPKTTMRNTIENMAIGDITQFPIAKARTIKTYCSDFNTMNNRKYKTTTKKADSLIVVERIS